MAKQIKFKVKISWWFTKVYLPGVLLILSVSDRLGFDVSISDDKIEYWLDKALTLETI